MLLRDITRQSREDDNTSVETQARRWYVRMQSGNQKPADIARFEQWLDADPEHLKSYLEFEKLWQMLGHFSEQPEVKRMRSEVAKRKTVAKPPVKPGFWRDKRESARSRCAAIVAAVLCVSLVAVIWPDFSEQTYRTGDGESQHLPLDGGSSMILDGGTRLSGRMIFKDASLMEVLDELNRYSDKKIVLDNADLKSTRVTAVLRTGDANNTLDILKSYFSVKSKEDKLGNIVLSATESDYLLLR